MRRDAVSVAGRDIVDAAACRGGAMTAIALGWRSAMARPASPSELDEGAVELGLSVAGLALGASDGGRVTAGGALATTGVAGGCGESVVPPSLGAAGGDGVGVPGGGIVITVTVVWLVASCNWVVS